MFTPIFTVSPVLAQKLVQIERMAAELRHAAITPTLLAGLRETAQIHTVHYSTFIEGNRLTMAEVQTLLHDGQAPAGREGDEGEVRGYYVALNQIADWVADEAPLTEARLQRLHALVMAEGRQTQKYSPYRDVQNVIRNAGSGAITYLPPEAQDVPDLMADLCAWLNHEDTTDLPGPVVAGLLHYQYVTIHPYLDGNGRSARLLTTWQMHRSGYDLGGIYSLEEHYAKNLAAYYASLALGPSHNYYFGRHEADVTTWLEYFVDGVLKSFSAVAERTKSEVFNAPKIMPEIYLDQRKRQFLERLPYQAFVKSKDLAELFGLSDRAARNLAQKWVDEGFLTVENPSKKSRLYRIAFIRS